MIIERYVLRQVVRPFLLVCLVLVLVFAGYSSSIFLGAASAGAISRDTISRLIALKTAVAMEVLLPIALYLTVVVGLGRLHANREMTALQACGFGTSRVLRAVLGIVLPVALLTGLLSTHVRPWAYRQMYALRAKAAQQVDLTRLKGGRFYFDKDRGRVLFADEVAPDGEWKGIFIALGEGEDRQILSAQRGHLGQGAGEGEQVLVLEDLHVYSMDSDPLSVMGVDKLELPLNAHVPAPPGYRRKAEPTVSLARSADPADIAELQWRLSRPFSTLFLGLFAVFLSHRMPRSGHSAALFGAALFYIVYYSTSIVARSWVQHGAVGSFPGMWWVDLLLGTTVSVLIVRSVRRAGEGLRR